MSGSTAVWLAVSAAVLQSAALVLAVSFWRRLRSPALVAVVAVAALLMAVRRLLAAVEGLDSSADGAVGLLHESLGLVVSALCVALVVGIAAYLGRAAPREPETPVEPRGAEAAAAREEERELLCYDLHDGLSQYVLGAQMHFEAFKGARGTDEERAERELAMAEQRLREAISEVHRVIANLSLPVSRQTSLSEAVECCLSRLAEANRWRYELEDNLEGRRCEPGIEATVFRVVQEALTNAAKHSGTDRVSVCLCIENGFLEATITDFGRGFDPDQARWRSRRLGLQSMCGRARLLGGSCRVQSAPGAGASVTIRVPCEPGEGTRDGGH